MSVATTDPGRDLRPAERAVLAAARSIEAEGLELTWTRLGCRSRLGAQYAFQVVRRLEGRHAGLWTWDIPVVAGRGRAGRPGPPPADLPDDGTVLAAADRVAARGGPVRVVDVAGELRIRTTRAWKCVDSLRRRGLWTHPSARSAEAGAFRVDPADVARVLAEARRGLRDGRAEDDEGPGGCRCGHAERYDTPTDAEVVRGLVREWEVRTGRVVPEVAPPGISPRDRAANLRHLEEIRRGRRERRGRGISKAFFFGSKDKSE